MRKGNGAPKRIRVTAGSCWQCRDRRVKCDTRNPTCGRCAAEGRECSYDKVRLRWGNAVASRGQLAGHQTPVPSPTCSALSRRDSGGQWQILYFEREIMPRFSLSERVMNADLESLAKDPVLSSAISAAASTHLLFSSPPTSGETLQENIRARTHAIRAFRERLQQCSDQTPEAFNASVLLCMLDGILEPQRDCAATQIHYQGGKAILQQSNSLERLASQNRGLPSLLLSVFATIDLTHGILSGHSPIFGPESWRALAGADAWWTGIEQDSAFLEVMALLAQIARHAHETYTSGQLPEIKEVLSLQLALERTRPIPQSPMRSNSPTDCHGESSTKSFAAFCTAFRSAGSIYLYRTLCGLHVADALVQSAVAEGIEAMTTTQFSGKHYHCLLFPILIIGSHCLDLEQRHQLMESINPTLSYLGFGSVKELQEFLAAAWRSQGDWDWWTQFRSIASRAFIF